VSLGSGVFTAATYFISHRPYIGITDIPAEKVGNPPSSLAWKIVLNNTGSVPGFAWVEENTLIVTSSSGASTTFPTLKPLGEGMIVMPGGINFLEGHYTEVGNQVPMSDILNGRAKLAIRFKLSYKPTSGFWPRQRYYRAHIQLYTPGEFATAFVMVSGEAN
jgi:hypothetical protein